MFRTSKFWLPKKVTKTPNPPDSTGPEEQQCVVPSVPTVPGGRHRHRLVGLGLVGVFSHNRNFLLGIWDTFLGGNNGYPRYHWVFFAYPEIHHMLTWLTFCRDKKWQETRCFMAEVDEYQLEKISTLFNSRPPYIPKSCILFLSILPFPWLFKTKKNGGPRIRWCNKLNRYSRMRHLESPKETRTHSVATQVSHEKYPFH